MTEPTGDWIGVANEEHQCKKPSYAERSKPVPKKGDRWQCHRCKRIWNVTGLNYGDQRDPINPPQIVWGQPYILESDLPA